MHAAAKPHRSTRRYPNNNMGAYILHQTTTVGYNNNLIFAVMKDIRRVVVP